MELNAERQRPEPEDSFRGAIPIKCFPRVSFRSMENAQKVFLIWVLSFMSLLKNQHLQIPVQPG